MNKTYKVKVIDGVRCIAEREFSQRHIAIRYAVANESLYTVNVSEVLSYIGNQNKKNEKIIYQNGWRIT